MKVKQASKSLCIRCKKNPKVEGFSKCQSCREYCNNKKEEKRLSFIKEGKCGHCGSEKAGVYRERFLCKKCATAAKNSTKLLRDKKIKDGFCSRCMKNKTIDGKSKCQSCIDYKRKHRQKNKKQGLCECGMTLHTDSMCLSCFTNRKQKISTSRKKTADKILKTLKKRKSKQGKDPYGFIYKAICQGNNKIYIGQTIDFNERQKDHIRGAFNRVTNTPFAKALRKHGKKNFKWEVIHDCYDKKELNYWEWHYINKFDSFCGKNGYNVTDGVLN